ncbi:uncharacterized protein RCC_08666 [Ramularia collo-cygni]|uniref:Integral membrane protein n=1 Tax=Ramularia collo-cygni TaxID=112498 RepID=A0A2D3VMT5_9PEZI|nr:uncharacterized protein RCC_08666 [Ramularia collo-cygni]CZT22958.1 uncharacterized protein RCC_08666 [Ramularia collo-cygni]
MFAILLLLPLLAALVSAQQNVLVNGNSQLPQCAQQCPLLQQANQACTATATPQAAWACFCQSAYIPTLKTSAVGVCDSTCTDATQNAQVSTWYNSNCGSDFGASEHAADTATAATTTAGAPAAAGTTSSGSSNAGNGNNNNNDAGSANQNSGSGTTDWNPEATKEGGDWWSTHYQWIVMVIVLAIGLSLFAWLAVWLKRRHDRKQDAITGGFNAGITERSAPDGGYAEKNASGTLTGASPVIGSGRNSPARTREAFMPYGYGYAKSESRLGSSQGVVDQRPTSPLAAPAMSNVEENGSMGPWPAENSSKPLSRAG